MSFDLQAFMADIARRRATHSTTHLRKKWVYCQSEGPGEPVKIGVSGDLMARLSAIQGHTWREVRIYWAVPGRHVHEAAVKALLKPRHLRAEWFSDPHDEIKLISDRNRFLSGDVAGDRKKAVLKYIARDFRWQAVFDTYMGPEAEKAHIAFDAEHREQIEQLANEAGLPLTDADFELRTFNEVERLIEKVAQIVTSGECS